jgi:hypothetical protein
LPLTERACRARQLLPLARVSHWENQKAKGKNQQAKMMSAMRVYIKNPCNDKHF